MEMHPLLFSLRIKELSIPFGLERPTNQSNELESCLRIDSRLSLSSTFASHGRVLICIQTLFLDVVFIKFGSTLLPPSTDQAHGVSSAPLGQLTVLAVPAFFCALGEDTLRKLIALSDSPDPMRDSVPARPFVELKSCFSSSIFRFLALEDSGPL